MLADEAYKLVVKNQLDTVLKKIEKKARNGACSQSTSPPLLSETVEELRAKKYTVYNSNNENWRQEVKPTEQMTAEMAYEATVERQFAYVMSQVKRAISNNCIQCVVKELLPEVVERLQKLRYNVLYTPIKTDDGKIQAKHSISWVISKG